MRLDTANRVAAAIKDDLLACEEQLALYRLALQAVLDRVAALERQAVGEQARSAGGGE